jgi:ribose 1,5-bisphosphokinase PhnN
MAFVGAANVEIAEFLRCSTDVLERRLADVFRKKRSSMRMRLRRAQLRLAQDGECDDADLAGQTVSGPG